MLGSVSTLGKRDLFSVGMSFSSERNLARSYRACSLP